MIIAAKSEHPIHDGKTPQQLADEASDKKQIRYDFVRADLPTIYLPLKELCPDPKLNTTSQVEKWVSEFNQSDDADTLHFFRYEIRTHTPVTLLCCELIMYCHHTLWKHQLQPIDDYEGRRAIDAVEGLQKALRDLAVAERAKPQARRSLWFMLIQLGWYASRLSPESQQDELINQLSAALEAERAKNAAPRAKSLETRRAKAKSKKQASIAEARRRLQLAAGQKISLSTILKEMDEELDTAGKKPWACLRLLDEWRSEIEPSDV